MHSGSGCHVRGVGPERLAPGKHRGDPVNVRAAEDTTKRLQTHLGGECRQSTFARNSQEYNWPVGRGLQHAYKDRLGNEFTVYKYRLNFCSLFRFKIRTFRILFCSHPTTFNNVSYHICALFISGDELFCSLLTSLRVYQALVLRPSFVPQKVAVDQKGVNKSDIPIRNSVIGTG
jgi:hypothetical protein